MLFCLFVCLFGVCWGGGGGGGGGGHGRLSMADDCKEVLDRLSTYFSMSVCLCIFRLDTGGSAVRTLHRFVFSLSWTPGARESQDVSNHLCSKKFAVRTIFNLPCELPVHLI